MEFEVSTFRSASTSIELDVPPNMFSGRHPENRLRRSRVQCKSASIGNGFLRHRKSPYDPSPSGRATTYTLELEGDITSSNAARDMRNENALRGRLEGFRSKEIRLIVITLLSKNTKLYAMIKRAADVYVGVDTICAVASWQYVGKDRFWPINETAQFLGNLLFKYNLILGGVNHWLGDQQRCILDRKMIFVGMDVKHPPPGAQNGALSIAAVVATEEPTYFVHWPASIRLQKPDKGRDSQKLIDDLQAMVTERLEHWRKKNGKLPEQVIIYGDGVSDGFYRLIKRYELAKMRLAFENVTRGYNPAMIYLVVLKRHSTRFFLSPAVSTAQQDHFTNLRLLDSRSNSKPGLLVNDTLTTRRDEVGYFLQSHECLKGELPKSFIRWLVL
jgi:eukaryotic translation initiation factor 2C